MLPEPQSTNLGVRSSNLFGRAIPIKRLQEIASADQSLAGLYRERCTAPEFLPCWKIATSIPVTTGGAPARSEVPTGKAAEIVVHLRRFRPARKHESGSSLQDCYRSSRLEGRGQRSALPLRRTCNPQCRFRRSRLLEKRKSRCPNTSSRFLSNREPSALLIARPFLSEHSVSDLPRRGHSARAHGGRVFSGLRTSCKVSPMLQWLFRRHPSCRCRRPATPVSLGSSFEQIQKIHMSPHISRQPRMILWTTTRRLGAFPGDLAE